MVILSKVYPRTHGETTSFAYCVRSSKGLSPYTRGNLSRPRIDILKKGSIPVHTGKPGRKIPGPPCIWVYPRTHGETKTSKKHLITHRGLSPYTRGNHRYFWQRDVLIGSIPVHTGKPYQTTRRQRKTMVYPRTHGETCTNVHFFLPRK